MPEVDIVHQDVLDTIWPQEQPKPEHLFENMSIKALVSIWPPLAQVTEVPPGPLEFTVFLQTDDAGLAEVWEVELWYWIMDSADSWKAQPLQQAALAKSRHLPCFNKTSCDGPPRIVFKGSIDITGPMRFTVRWRVPSKQKNVLDMTWIKDHQGIQDGFLVVKGRDLKIEELGDISEVVQGLGEEYHIEKAKRQVPGSTVWTVEIPVEGAVDDKAQVKTLQFGKPWRGSYSRWMALVRLWAPWLAPRQGRGNDINLDKEAVLCSFAENWNGRHLVLLAVSGVDDVTTTFVSAGFGNVNLNVRNDSSQGSVARVIVAVGDSFEVANCAATYQARDVVRARATVTDEVQEEPQAAKDAVKPQYVDDWLSGLTYCTWNAMGQQVSEEKIFHAIGTLAENGINVTNLIVDDGWQTIDNPTGGQNQFQQGMVRFEAREEAFPNGLEAFGHAFRKKFPSVVNLAVWHTLLGYWAGIAAEGEIAKKYKTRKVLRTDNERRNLPLGGYMTVVDEKDVDQMYHDFYDFLRKCKVTAVKTDAQFMVESIVSASARASLEPAYLRAWERYSQLHGFRRISCMSQVPSIIFRNQLPNIGSSMSLRNSDDYFPHIPSSHAWHVFANASNALLTQHLNVIPDWDMFQTVHEYSSFHAAARCVSGGPITITDIPGQHDIDLINQICGTNAHGKTVVFRPSTFGKTIDAYQKYEELVLLKVGTYHGPGVTGTGILGLFNVSMRPISELLHISLFPGVVEANYYIVRSHTSGRVTKPLQVVDYSVDALIQIQLEERGWDILSAFLLRGFIFEEGIEGEHTLWVAQLGLLGKMTGVAASSGTSMVMKEGGRVEVKTSLAAFGRWGVYISWLQYHEFATNWRDKVIVSIQDQIVPYRTVKINEECPLIMEVDVEAAWKEMGLVPDYRQGFVVRMHILCE